MVEVELWVSESGREGAWMTWAVFDGMMDFEVVVPAGATSGELLGEILRVRGILEVVG